MAIAAKTQADRRSYSCLIISAVFASAAVSLAMLSRGGPLTNLSQKNDSSPAASPVRIRRTAVLVQADSRMIVDDFSSAQYHSLTAVINYIYAKRHNHSFVRFELAVDHFVHPLLGHDRYNSWTKIPFWWAATLDDRFDWVVGLDSDAFVSEHDIPVQRFPAEFLLGQPYWGARPGDGALTLLRDTAHPDFVEESFGSQTGAAPSNPDPDTYCGTRYANCGFALIRSGLVGESLVRRWWDVNDSVSTRIWPFEQDAVGALWRAGGAVRGNFTVACSPRHGFYKAAEPGQWVRHFPSMYNDNQRNSIIREFATRFGINSITYGPLVAEMRTAGAVHPVSMLELSKILQDMARRSLYAPGGATFDANCGGNQCACVYEGGNGDFTTRAHASFSALLLACAGTRSRVQASFRNAHLHLCAVKIVCRPST